VAKGGRCPLAMPRASLKAATLAFSSEAYEVHSINVAQMRKEFVDDKRLQYSKVIEEVTFGDDQQSSVIRFTH